MNSTTSNVVWTIAVRCRAVCVALFLASAPFTAYSAAADDSDIVVHAERNGSQVIVDIRMNVDAPAALTWQVMTDYDHMADYISNLELSRTLSRDGNHLTVAQRGTASWGLFKFDFDNVRAIDLGPGYSVHSRMISGDMLSSNFVTEVLDRGPGSQLLNHGEFVPRQWIPPIIGVAVIEAEARKQFQQFRDEVLRRQRKAQRSP